MFIQGFPDFLARIDSLVMWRESDMKKQSHAWIMPLSQADMLALEGAMPEFHSTAAGFVPPRR